MDKELDDLLDSALNDFETKNETVEVTTAAKVTIERTNLYVDDIDYEDRPVRQTMPDTKPTIKSSLNAFNPTAAMPSSNKLDDLKLFDEIFNDEKSKESMKQFQAAFDMLQTGGDDPKMLENFQKVLSDLASTDLGDDDDDDFENIEGFDFLKSLTKMQQEQTKPVSSTIKTEEKATTSSSDAATAPKPTPLQKVLEDMNKNSEKVLKNDSFPFGADFLSSLASSLNEGDNLTGDDNLDSASSLMMQPILSMLFSKEILYPSLKLMNENYVKYIEEKKEKLNAEELKKCNDQKGCIEQMCKVYEESKENDSQEAKTAQLKTVLDLLEKCGVFFEVIITLSLISIMINWS